MRKLQMFGAVALLVPFTAMAADTPEIKEGRWEEVMTMTSMTVGGKPIDMSAIPESSTSRFACISHEKAIDPAKHFLSVGQTGKCTPNGMVTSGQIHVIGQCSSSKFENMIITADGSYKLSTYDVSAKMTGKLKDRPVVVAMTIKGRHVGACNGTES